MTHSQPTSPSAAIRTVHAMVARRVPSAACRHAGARDPDDIALEFSSSNELMIAAREALSSGQMTPADIGACIAKNVDPAFVAGQQSGPAD